MSLRNLPATVKIIGIWLVGALLIGIPLARFNLVWLYKLSKNAVATRGTVTALEPGNHRTVRYTFDGNGRSYSAASQGGAGTGNPSFESLAIGDQILVYYLRDDPSVSCLGSPAAEVKNEEIPIGLAMLIFPSFAITGWYFRYPSFRSWLLNRPSGPASQN